MGIKEKILQARSKKVVEDEVELSKAEKIKLAKIQRRLRGRNVGGNRKTS